MKDNEILEELRKINSNLERLISLSSRPANSTNNAEKIKNDVKDKINLAKLKIEHTKQSMTRDKE